MKRITDSLATEHDLFCRLFDEIGRLLPELSTVEEARRLSRLVAALLSHHASVEENLAFPALDHALAEAGGLHHLYQDHEEIDGHLMGAALAPNLPEAIRLLKVGMKATRAHFRREEQQVFPLLEKSLTPAALDMLGDAAIADRLALGRRGFDNTWENGG